MAGKIGQRGTGLVEPTLVQLSDGSQLMLIRHATEHRLYESRSYDLGETWSKAIPTNIPSAISKSSLIKDKNGNIYLLSKFSENGRRSPLSLWISHDDTKTWETKIDLVESDDTALAYPDPIIDEDRQLLYFGWDDRSHIYFSEFPLPS